jgi:hypothetical protein
MGPTAGLDDVEKRKLLTLQGLDLPLLGSPACSRCYTDYVIPATIVTRYKLKPNSLCNF